MILNETPDIYFVIYDGLPSFHNESFRLDISMFDRLLINNNLKN